MSSNPNNVSRISDHQKPTAAIMLITPEVARRVLERNTHNRPVSAAHVQEIRDEILGGRWQYNGEAIKWSIGNELLDGQHRLLAIAGLPDGHSGVPVLVVRNLPSEAQETMDQGRRRGAGDQLVLAGQADSGEHKIVAGAIRVYSAWHNGLLFRDSKLQKMSAPETVAWAREHPVELAVMKSMLTPELRRVKVRPSLALAVATHLALIDGEATREFVAHLATGAGLDAGNPCLTLRDRLSRIREASVTEAERDLIAYFIVTWNAWREGKSLNKIQRPRGGRFTAENFPAAR